jgi:hypothetical protein
VVFHNLGGGYVQKMEIKAMSNVKLHVRDQTIHHLMIVTPKGCWEISKILIFHNKISNLRRAEGRPIFNFMCMVHDIILIN